MPSHIAVVPASTKAGKETIRVLLNSESKPLVRGFYRDISKAPAEFTQNANFEAVQGDVGTGDGLDFGGSNAVFYIPPPIYDGTDTAEWATRSATNMKKALAAAPSVKRLLIFSAMGSQNSHSIGVLKLNHISDEILKNVVPEVLIIRPSYFFEEFAYLLDEAKADPPVITSWLTPIDHKIPMVSLKDISECCANSLLSEETKPSPHYFKLFGPQLYSSRDLKNAVEEVTGKEVELKLVEKDELPKFWSHMLPEAYVQDFVGMTSAILPDGIISKDFVYDDNTIAGKVKFVDALRQMYTK
ncbi:NAD(P)H azoreductase [Fusarium albosuccineum]|uniref:NAD(P)H azoreductase n=1 Tax=Fusarium albosuccineum TaxID=1237068 RepID=A0A8H4P6W4_9HYPO|nr:NAD(P)H azoreductase [Fusarium albosuccineum]